MTRPPSPYASAFAFLHTLNRSLSPEARKFFFRGGVNWWQAYQQLLFAEIKSGRYKKENSRQSLFSFLALHFFGVLSVFFSLASFLWIILRRKKILVYSIDRIDSRYLSDNRLLPLYEALSFSQISYTEVFHTILSRKTFENLFQRKRSALYLESFSWAFDVLLSLGIISLPKFPLETLSLSFFETEEERRSAKRLFLRYARRALFSEWLVKVLTPLLKKSSLRAFYGIDDMRYCFELLEACRNTGIKTHLIQHGHITKYHVGWLNSFEERGPFICADTLFLWSDYWKQELCNLHTYYPESSLIVAGGKRVLNSPFRTRSFEENVSLQVLVPYETDAPKEEVRLYIETLLSSGEKIIFKLRTDFPEEEQLRSYGLFPIPEGVLATFSFTLSDADVALGSYSTLLYEAVEAGVPTLLMKTSLDYASRMVENGLAQEIDSASPEFHKVLRTAASLSLEERKRRAKMISSEGKMLRETLQNSLNLYA